MKVSRPINTSLLVSYVLKLFHSKYTSGAVRSVAVSYSGFVDESFGLISLFDDVDKLEKEERLQTAIDAIREQFGFTSLLKANALEEASRSLARSKLIGGTFCWRIRWTKMIDRSYLPFQSARDYQDPGMQKWMGFYLSEHTSSLSEEKNRVDFSTDLDPVEKLHLLSQLYISQLKGLLWLRKRGRRRLSSVR